MFHFYLRKAFENEWADGFGSHCITFPKTNTEHDKVANVTLNSDIVEPGTSAGRVGMQLNLAISNVHCNLI